MCNIGRLSKQLVKLRLLVTFFFLCNWMGGNSAQFYSTLKGVRASRDEEKEGTKEEKKSLIASFCPYPNLFTITRCHR